MVIIRRWICIISDCTTDVCAFLHVPLLTPNPPSMHFVLQGRNEMSFSPIFALHKVRQGASRRETTTLIHQRPPKHSSFSLLCAEVALSILILACMRRIIIHSVYKVIKARIRCIQNPEGAAFSHNVSFFLMFYPLLPLVLCDRFCGLYIPIPENLPAVERIPNTSWSALLSRFS